jgi:hypothetical protein
MSFDIHGKDGAYFRTNNWGWGELLKLACKYGWQPVGTEAPGEVTITDPKTGESWRERYHDPEKWDGTYFTNDYQIVTDADAKALGETLERALAANDYDAEHDVLNPVRDAETGRLRGLYGVKRLATLALAGGFTIG